jgi:hypothetical protein
MSTRLDRMIARARAPLSALQPVVPSMLAPEVPFPEGAQKNASEQYASANQRLDPDTTPSPSSLAQTARTASRRKNTVSHASNGEEDLPSSQSVDSSSLRRLASLAENASLLLRDDATLPADPFSASAPRAERFRNAAVRPAADDARPTSHAAHELTPPDASAEHSAHISNDAAARLTAAKQVPLQHSAAPAPAESLVEINVSIGSIDFRAARSVEPVKRSESHPRVTLDSYLRRGKRDAR